MNRPVRIFLLLCSVLYVPACAGLPDKISTNIFGSLPVSDSYEQEAGTLLSALKDKNSNLKTFKGTGRVTFSGKNRALISADIAWIAEDTDKISMALRDILGRPIANLSSDGQWFYFVSHADNTYYKDHSDNAVLENFISVPVRIKDVIMLLSGRVPLYEFDSAAVTYAENGGRILALKKKWSGSAEKIYFGSDCQDAAEVEIFDTWGELLYRASFEGKQIVNEYDIPARIVISDGAGDYLKLDIVRFWADVPVSRSAFVLNLPEKNGE